MSQPSAADVSAVMAALGSRGGKARALKLGAEACREAARKAGRAPKSPRKPKASQDAPGRSEGV